MLKFHSVSVNGMIVRGPNIGIVFFIITLYFVININAQITHVLVVLMFENLPEKTLVNHKTHFDL